MHEEGFDIDLRKLLILTVIFVACIISIMFLIK